MRRLLILIGLVWLAATPCPSAAAERDLMIVASPSVSDALTAVANAYERSHPDVRIRISYDSGLDLRRTVAAVENDPRGRFFIGTGPIHLIAPGGDELLQRLEEKHYALPGTRHAYVEERLVLIVPEALAEAPNSFEALRRGAYRIAVADPERTQTGRMTAGLLHALGLTETVSGQLDVASDARGVLDHLLSGQADVGIALAREAVKERQRVRIVAISDAAGYEPVIHSMAMERYCPDRVLCEEFLAFSQSAEAQEALRRLGYAVPASVGQASGR